MARMDDHAFNQPKPRLTGIHLLADAWEECAQILGGAGAIGPFDAIDHRTDLWYAACHGLDGSGNEALGSPPINHQNDWYMLTQLQHFKAGVRGTAPGDVQGALMRPMSMTLPDEQAMKATIAELVTATEFAERAVQGLKATARECEATLGERLADADRFCENLDRQVGAADVVLTRLSRVVVAARALNEVPAAASAPDPKAVAAAARSFADRLRARMDALAA